MQPDAHDSQTSPPASAETSGGGASTADGEDRADAFPAGRYGRFGDADWYASPAPVPYPAALAAMEARFGGNRLVMDKWFSVQVAAAPPRGVVATAERLAERPDFDSRNPNRLRALIGGLAANTAAFHAADGSGYRFVAGWVGRIDRTNPQIAARLVQVFETWPRHDARRRDNARTALRGIAELAGLSRNTSEMVSRLLSAGSSDRP